jgi:hypothetical protein
MSRADPIREKQYQREYFQKNKERLVQQRREYYERTGYQQKYYQENKERLQEYHRIRAKTRVLSEAQKRHKRDQRRSHYHRVVKVRENLKYLETLKEEPVPPKEIKKVFIIVQ